MSSFLPSIPFSDDLGRGESTRGIHRLMAVLYELRYKLRYVDNLTLKVDKDYRMHGTLLHLVLADYYARKMEQNGLPPPPWLHALNPATGREWSLDERLMTVGVGFTEEIRATREFHNYYLHVARDEDWQPIAVERELLLALIDFPEIREEAIAEGLGDEQVTCRGDLTVVRNGGLWAVDYKSMNYAKKDTLPPWREGPEHTMSLQMLFQLRALRAAYGAERVKGVIIMRLKRNAPYHYDRHPIVFDELLYRRSAFTILGRVRQEREIRARVAAGKPIVPCLGECRGNYTCDYINLCQASAAVMPLVLKADFTKRTP